MTPTLVAHSMLAAHLKFQSELTYQEWLTNSFRKAVVTILRKVFDKIAAFSQVHLGHENNTKGGIETCVIPLPVMSDNVPNALKFAKLWKLKDQMYNTL